MSFSYLEQHIFFKKVLNSIHVKYLEQHNSIGLNELNCLIGGQVYSVLNVITSIAQEDNLKLTNNIETFNHLKIPKNSQQFYHLISSDCFVNFLRQVKSNDIFTEEQRVKSGREFTKTKQKNKLIVKIYSLLLRILVNNNIALLFGYLPTRIRRFEFAFGFKGFYVDFIAKCYAGSVKYEPKIISRSSLIKTINTMSISSFIFEILPTSLIEEFYKNVEITNNLFNSVSNPIIWSATEYLANDPFLYIVMRNLQKGRVVYHSHGAATYFAKYSRLPKGRGVDKIYFVGSGDGCKDYLKGFPIAHRLPGKIHNNSINGIKIFIYPFKYEDLIYSPKTLEDEYCIQLKNLLISCVGLNYKVVFRMHPGSSKKVTTFISSLCRANDNCFVESSSKPQYTNGLMPIYTYYSTGILENISQGCRVILLKLVSHGPYSEDSEIFFKTLSRNCMYYKTTNLLINSLNNENILDSNISKNLARKLWNPTNDLVIASKKLRIRIEREKGVVV